MRFSELGFMMDDETGMPLGYTLTIELEDGEHKPFESIDKDNLKILGIHVLAEGGRHFLFINRGGASTPERLIQHANAAVKKLFDTGIIKDIEIWKKYKNLTEKIQAVLASKTEQKGSFLRCSGHSNPFEPIPGKTKAIKLEDYKKDCLKRIARMTRLLGERLEEMDKAEQQQRLR